MVQGLNKEYIFNSKKNKNIYKKIIIKNLNKQQFSGLKILSYCIMDNHTHFIFFCKKFSILSKFMQSSNMTFSNYYNKSQNRVGYVFRDRFKVQEINSRAQLFNCLKYIHNNPVKANICKEMDEYLYSSYNEFLNPNNRVIIDDESINLIFGDCENFKKLFLKIHKKCNSEDFIEEKISNFSKFFKDFLDKNSITFSDLTNDKILLKSFIKKAKKETTITLLGLSKKLNIPVSTVHYYFSKN